MLCRGHCGFLPDGGIVALARLEMHVTCSTGTLGTTCDMC
ncbi:hypothetical protein MBOL_19660 [Mycobacteroides abscessus subsp. bolletii BD]|nr:hypothetical protein MBOL_19660 [Mycobacteroides abscessus subsp. bolletii BD]